MKELAELTEKQKKRRQAFLDWDLSGLPETIGTFHRKRIDRQEGRIYYAFGYEDEETGWEARALFDEETMDYMVKFYLRMYTITEIELIHGDFDGFRRDVERLLPAAITREFLRRDRVSVLVKGRAFTQWDYAEVLPPSYDGYRLLISPDRPLLGLNGSYIIAEYENREKNTGILFFYNMYRDEYYGELRDRGIPGIVHEYDARTVEELEKKIRLHLKKDLDKLGTGPLER